MGKAIDLTGQKFGRLTVLECAGKDKHGAISWRCVCECGGEKIANTHNLKYGATKSCGCLTLENRQKQKERFKL